MNNYRKNSNKGRDYPVGIIPSGLGLPFPMEYEIINFIQVEEKDYIENITHKKKSKRINNRNNSIKHKQIKKYWRNK